MSTKVKASIPDKVEDAIIYCQVCGSPVVNSEYGIRRHISLFPLCEVKLRQQVSKE